MLSNCAPWMAPACGVSQRFFPETSNEEITARNRGPRSLRRDGAFYSSNTFNGLVLSDSSARLLGGVQVGADWQFAPNWVVGAEGQYSWLGKNNINATFPGGFVYNNNQRGLGSVTGRVGYAAGPALCYIKGGYAYSNNRETLTFGGVPVAFVLDGSHSNGWTV